MPALRDFRLPPAINNKLWSLTEKEKLFIDCTLFLPMQQWEVYRMVMSNGLNDKQRLTDVQYKTRASACITSLDGAEYVKKRFEQIQKHFYPDPKDREKAKIGADGFSEGFQDKVIHELETILDNPQSPVFFDALKVVFQKLSKDISEKNIVSPPARYLPVVPCGECRYKVFCEDELEDECRICKYRQFANDNGVEYTYKNQLDRKLDPVIYKAQEDAIKEMTAEAGEVEAEVAAVAAEPDGKLSEYDEFMEFDIEEK